MCDMPSGRGRYDRWGKSVPGRFVWCEVDVRYFCQSKSSKTCLWGGKELEFNFPKGCFLGTILRTMGDIPVGEGDFSSGRVLSF